MAIVYKNIQNGKEVLLTAAQYEKYLASSSKFESHFLKAFQNIIEDYSVELLSNGTKLYTIKCKSVEKQFRILWGPLKNSGIQGNDNKRIQVLSTVTLDKETPYFAIGAYETVDSVLYTMVIGGVREFIKHAQNGNSYSSLWINYGSLWDTYKQGVYEWRDKKGRKILACKEDQMDVLHDAIKEILSSKQDDSELVGEISDDNFSFVDFTKEVNKYTTDESLPRNPNFRELALIRENYTCELCKTQQTFTDKNNYEYFEGHHLIMYNLSAQKRFKYCLDHPNNIICLCPNCHREIHHSSDERTKELIVKLFTKHNNLLTEYDIKSLNDIINDYIN